MPLNLGAIATLRARLTQATADEARDVILAVSNARIPVDTSTAMESGRVVVDGETVYVTYGLDTDDNPKTHQPSNTYIAEIHEDMAKRHPNGRQAKFLESAADDAVPSFAAGVAARAKV